MSNSQTSNSQTQPCIDCTSLTGVDAQACQSLQHAVTTNGIDLSSPAGQYTAYLFHQVAFDALQRQQQQDEAGN